MNTHDELEELLGRELHGQVDGMNTARSGCATSRAGRRRSAGTGGSLSASASRPPWP